MGTSGSYAGSSRSRWQSARSGLSDLASHPDDEDVLQGLFQTIVDAIASEDQDSGEDEQPAPAGERPDNDARPVADLPAGGGAGGGGGSGAVGGRRLGAGSTRAFVGGARRGARVLAAGYALRSGDADALSSLGLDLGALQGMGPAEQRNQILSVLLGPASHPDEAALRRASNQFLRVILTAPQVPDALEAVRGFVGEYLWELALVEISEDLQSGATTREDAQERERRIREYIGIRLQREDFGATDGSVSPAALQSTAARVARVVLRMSRRD